MFLSTANHNTAPFKAIQAAVRRGYLGDLNPIPWVFMTGNCVGWVGYSYLRKVRFAGILLFYMHV
jgi:hypothetical protein